MQVRNSRSITFALGFYLAGLYENISTLIEERRAALTSAIYSAPTMIQVGDDIDHLNLIERLHRLSYTQTPSPTSAGEFAIIEPGVVMLGYSVNRSTKEGAEQVEGWMRERGWEVLTVPLPPQFVHLDAALVMIAEKRALVCEDALERYSLDFLRAHGVSWTVVEYRDCVKLGGNLLPHAVGLNDAGQVSEM